jgi:ribosomal-protein-alanine N-acetyltransferase
LIKTLRLFLEPVRATHAAAMFAGLRDERAYKYLSEDPPQNVQALSSRYALLAGQVSPTGEVWLNWMLRRRGAEYYVGYVQATIYRKRHMAMIAYHIFPAFWGQHLAREAVKGMIGAIGAEYGLKEVRAQIDPRNEASLKVVESLGFVVRGTVPAGRSRTGPPEDDLYVLTLES